MLDAVPCQAVPLQAAIVVVDKARVSVARTLSDKACRCAVRKEQGRIPQLFQGAVGREGAADALQAVGIQIDVDQAVKKKEREV